MKNYDFPILGEEKELPFFVISTGYCDNNDLVFSKTGYPFYRLFICTSGQGILKYDGYNYTIAKNNALIIPPGKKIDINQTTKSISLYWINFHGSSTDSLIDKYFSFDNPVMNIDDMDIVMRIYDKISNYNTDAINYFNMSNSIDLYMLILEIHKQHRFYKYKNRSVKLKQLMPIIEYMNNNIEKDITLDQLSEIGGFTPQYICRLFRECLNLRPFEYFTKVRIAHAKKILLETDLHINKIGESIGFSDCSYFCSAFKKSENCSPAEFREINK